MTETRSGLSRRTLAKGAAWAAPAVALASAAPAMASSLCTYTLTADEAQSCKNAPIDAYSLVFKVVATGANCPPTTNCTALITKIVSDTGGQPVLWSDPAGVPSGTRIDICAAGRMAAWVNVHATITCGGQTVSDVYSVKMSSIKSTGSTCLSGDFCGPTTTVAAPATQASTTTAKVDSNTTTAKVDTNTTTAKVDSTTAKVDTNTTTAKVAASTATPAPSAPETPAPTQG